MAQEAFEEDLGIVQKCSVAETVGGRELANSVVEQAKVTQASQVRLRRG